MNLLDMQSIISIEEEFLDDEQQHSQFTIKYLTWDGNGIGSEQTAIFNLTALAQDEILKGIIKIKKHLTHETF
jgi:hypothetical protein